MLGLSCPKSFNCALAGGCLRRVITYFLVTYKQTELTKVFHCFCIFNQQLDFPFSFTLN